MKKVTVSLAGVMLVCMPILVIAQTSINERQVRQAVQSFYDAFNSHGFDRASQFATQDWNHINPFGGRTRGRVATVTDLQRVHSTFLKNVSDAVEEMDVRFATPNVAVATVTSRVSTYTTPDGVKHENERNIRTFVVVKRGGQWLIMQDHNTIIGR